MRGLLIFIGSTIGGSVGWWAGEYVGIMTAATLSAVGTGIGIYYANKFHKNYGNL